MPWDREETEFIYSTTSFLPQRRAVLRLPYGHDTIELHRKRGESAEI